jgi:hypothetical protein
MLYYGIPSLSRKKHKKYKNIGKICKISLSHPEK